MTHDEQVAVMKGQSAIFDSTQEKITYIDMMFIPNSDFSEAAIEEVKDYLRLELMLKRHYSSEGA